MKSRKQGDADGARQRQRQLIHGQAASGESDGRKQIAHGFADSQQRGLRQRPTEKTTRDGTHERKDHSFAQDET